MGFIKCKWQYKENIIDKNKTKVTGEGYTIDDKIYVLKELDINKTISKLLVKVNKKVEKIYYNYNNNLEINKNNSSNDGDSINLEDMYIFKTNKSLKEEKEKKNNFNKLKKYDYDSDIDIDKSKFDIDCSFSFGFRNFFKKCFKIFK